MKLAYLDCSAGVSGDMILGALIDAGAERDRLLSLPQRLGLDRCRVEIRETTRAGFRAMRVEILGDDEEDERKLATIKKILAAAEIPAPVKEKTIKAFTMLAEAEARVHGCGADEVHFHETGATDAIIDITGAVLLLDDLKIEELVVSPLPMPMGMVECSHGTIPLPAPALTEILKGVEVYGVEWREECVTPTGAAIVTTLASGFGPMPGMRLERCSCGGGRREKSGPLPNILRLFIGNHDAGSRDEVEVIECNIDDMVPELAATMVEKLFEAGALDATLTPLLMKKGRPGFQLQILARPADGPALRDLVFRESSTIGLRYRRQPRMILPRCGGTVDTAIGRVRVKKIKGPAGERITPEHEDCRRIARELGLPLAEVYREVARADAGTFKLDSPASGF